jgi:hypothetical protein
MDRVAAVNVFDSASYLVHDTPDINLPELEMSRAI